MIKPPAVKKKLKNGFYFEVRNKGSKSGVILRRETKDLMSHAVQIYKRSKDVIILGNSQNGKWVTKNEEKDS